MSTDLVHISGTLPSAAEEDAVLKKHAAIVHTDGKLSLLESKAVNVLLLNAYDNLLTKREHVIPVRLFSSLIGYKSKDTVTLKQALKRIQRSTIEFNLLDNAGKERWGSGSLLAWVEMYDGKITYQYAPTLAERLFDPDVYARINLRVQKSFTSSYSLSLYENCARFRDSPSGSTGFWDIDKWRRLLGAEAASYDEYKFFKRLVLDEAINEVNKHSDIFITLEVKKDERDKRRVAELRFLVTPNPRYNAKQTSIGNSFLPPDDLGIRASDTFTRLLHHGISERLAIQIIKQDPDLAKALVDDAEEKDKRGKIKVSTGAYIKGMIDKGADPRPSLYEREKKRDQTRAKQIAEAEIEGTRAKDEAERTAFAAASDRFDALSEQERERITKAWYDQANKYDRQFYDKDPTHYVVRVNLIVFYKKKIARLDD